jgi:arginyl-tRNA synthetase
MFKETIAELIAKKTGVLIEQILPHIEVPPQQEMGDYAFPCFILAKQLKKNPQEIAKDLEGLKCKELEKIEAKGPYVNFFINKTLLAKQVLSAKTKPKKKNYKVMVEYSQPNTHKEFHVGHLRTLFLGESIVRILQKNGYTVTRANYIGDVGAHVAKCIWGYLKFHHQDDLPDNKGRFLGSIYTEAHKYAEEHPEVKEEISKIQQKLENNDRDMNLIWLKTREWSLKEFTNIYAELGVHFDVIYFESEVEKEGKAMVGTLLKKGIAIQDQGAILVDLEKEKLGKFLLLKTDGTSLYATKDLALATKKFEEYALDESIYIVDSRQKLYFQQLFATLQKMGFHKKMVHIPYEFVSLHEGVISSRKGIIALYEDVRDAMRAKAEEEVHKRHEDWSSKKQKETAMGIAQGALKFSLLKIDNNKVIVFDIQESLDFEGETGPYVQYTHARIASILKKHGKKSAKIDYALLKEPEERNMLNKLQEFEKITVEAGLQYKPSLVARYLIELAQEFNEYYHKHNILKAEEETKKARIVLCRAVQKTLAEGLDLLNITALDEM